MERITSFLSGPASNFISKEKATKQRATEALAGFFGIPHNELPPIELQNGILYIRGGGALKHAIQLRKTEVLDSIQRAAGKDNVKDVR